MSTLEYKQKQLNNFEISYNEFFIQLLYNLINYLFEIEQFESLSCVYLKNNRSIF